jgi:hypothetical protein
MSWNVTAKKRLGNGQKMPREKVPKIMYKNTTINK